MTDLMESRRSLGNVVAEVGNEVERVERRSDVQEVGVGVGRRVQEVLPENNEIGFHNVLDAAQLNCSTSYS